nr:hypothetical protein HUO10_002011 [Paraburkholderia busanensis]
MSTTFAGSGGMVSAWPFLGPWMGWVRWIRWISVPFGAWSRRRRWSVAAVIAMLVFAVGARGWIAADLSGVEVRRAALAASAQRLVEARRASAELPGLRREVQALGRGMSGVTGGMAAMAAAGAVDVTGATGAAEVASAAGSKKAETATGLAPAVSSWSSADDVRVVSELAARNEVTLLTLDPGVASGVGPDSVRPLQLTARTDFVHLMAFLRGLSDLPVLIVPVEMTIKREAAALSMNATLHVFSALRPVPLDSSANVLADDASLDVDDDEDVVFFDPFSPPQMFAAGGLADFTQLRLAGLLHDRTHGLALLDTPDGAATIVAGQQIGGERVMRLDALGVTLARGESTRTLTMTETS